MEVKTTQIKLLVECLNNYWIVTSRDEYGEVAIGKDWTKLGAINKCKRRTERLIEGSCEYEEIELNDTYKEEDDNING